MKRLFKAKESRSSDESRGKSKESDFGGWGEYFHAKLQKLDRQFEEEKAQGSAEDRVNTKIFENVVIHVNGYTNPSSDELRRLVGLHGGRYVQYYSKSTVTHIIATNLPNSKIKELRNEKVVRPEWITDSIKMGKLCAVTPYLLYSRRTIAQPSLQVSTTCSSMTMQCTGSSKDEIASPILILASKEKTQNWSENPKESEKEISCTKVTEVCDTNVSECETNDAIDLLITDPSSNENTTVCRSYSEDLRVTQEQIANTTTQLQVLSTKTSESLDESEESLYAGTENLDKHALLQNPRCTSGEPSTSNAVDQDDNQARVSSSVCGHPKAGDPNFVSTFYSNSRLHYLSTWSAELKQFVNKLVSERQESGERQANVNKGKVQKERVIMHIDMDCFFVSVTLCERPELRGKPIAVCHAGRTSGGHSDSSEGDVASHGGSVDKYLNSMSEIASCSYEARACGVRNGKFLGAARKLCPNLICVPYEFDKYRKVSQQLYEILVSYSHEIEAVSCDEAYIDVTSALQENQTPMELAHKIRQEIKDATGCPASVGISYNVLLARMCTREAKPNGQFYLPSNPPEAVERFIGQQKVGDLPGVGWALRDKLEALDVHTCAELQQLSLQTLQQHFGNKTGQNLYSVCRGEDDRPLKTEHARKSVSAEINYGIRFTQSKQADRFIEELAEEVNKRLLGVGLKGKNVTLKLKVRKKGAPMPAKFMGHGICDNIARSCTLPTATDDSRVISSQCIGLFHKLKVAVPDIRGMGIQVSKLTGEEDGLQARKVEKGSLLQFIKPVLSNEEMCEPLGVPISSEQVGSDKESLVIPLGNHSISNQITPTSTDVEFQSSEIGDVSLPPLPRFSPSFNSPGAGTSTRRTNQADNDYLPSPSQIDPTVFAALPYDIRSSLEREYASRNQKLQLNKRSSLKQTDESMPDKETVLPIIECTQDTRLKGDKNQGTEKLVSPTEIDPSFLEALPEDLRREVEQEFESKRNKKTLAEKQTNVILSPIKYSNCAKVSSPSRNRSPYKRRSPVKNKSPLKNSFSLKGTSPSKAQAKSDILLVEKNSSSKLQSTERIKEAQVSLAGAITLPEVKQLLRQWVASCDGWSGRLGGIHSCLPPLQTGFKSFMDFAHSGPCADDVQVMVTYMSELITSYNLEHMWSVLKFLHRLLGSYPGWRQSFADIVENVQDVVYRMYGSRLPRLPFLMAC